METPFLVEVEYWNLVPDARLHITLHFYTEQQIIAFTSASIETDSLTGQSPLSTGLYRSVCHVGSNLLNSGIHRILLLVVQNTDTVIYRREDVLSFDVLDLGIRRGTWYGKEPGAIHPLLEWQTEYLGDLERVIEGRGR
jgi:lipopolysaccharide transport system ATP-binding protein